MRREDRDFYLFVLVLLVLVFAVLHNWKPLPPASNSVPSSTVFSLR
jgi:hypothetical protein